MPTKSKPKAGEAKQDFLARCAKEVAGQSETRAMAECAKSWGLARLSDFIDEGKLTLAAPVEIALAAEGEQDKADRFSILAYTGKIIDLGYWGRFVIDLSGITTKSKFPILREHRRDRIVGTADQAEAADSGFMVSGNFSRVTADATEVLALAREGYPWQASIGVRAKKILKVEKGQTHGVNGQVVEGPIDVWMSSEVFETSFVSLGADDETAAIAMSAEPGRQNHNLSEDIAMNELLKLARRMLNLSAEITDAEMLAKLGLTSEATEEQILAALQNLEIEIKTPTRSGSSQAGELAEQALARAKADAAAQARRDSVALYGRCRSLGLETNEADALLSAGLSLEQATAKLFAKAAEKNPPLGGDRIEGGDTEREKFLAAASDGVSMRLGVRVEAPAAGFEEFRGRSLLRLAEDCLHRAGVNVRGLSSMEIAGLALGLQNRALLSVSAPSASDFPLLMSNVARRRLLSAYNEAPVTYDAWVNIVDAADFRPMQGIDISALPELQLLSENGEYREVKLTESGQSYAVKTYGNKFVLSRKMLINDDLRAFDRIPRQFGSASRRTVNVLVYGLLASNPVMSDGVALFHADHGNLISLAGAKTYPSSASLAEMQRLMRTRKDIGGRANLNLSMRYVLVGSKHETNLDLILTSSALPETQYSSGVDNPWRRKGLVPIVDATLDNYDADAWYGVPDKNEADTVEVAFLNGVQEPYLEDWVNPENDGVNFKCRLDVGVGVMSDHILKNPGK